MLCYTFSLNLIWPLFDLETTLNTNKKSFTQVWCLMLWLTNDLYNSKSNNDPQKDPRDQFTILVWIKILKVGVILLGNMLSIKNVIFWLH